MCCKQWKTNFALATVPFESAKILAKPFKPPSKIGNHQSEIPPPQITTTSNLAEKVGRHLDNPLPKASSIEPVPRAGEGSSLRWNFLTDLSSSFTSVWYWSWTWESIVKQSWGTILYSPKHRLVLIRYQKPARRKAEFNKIRRGLFALNFDQLVGSTGVKQPKWQVQRLDILTRLNWFSREHLVYHVAREIEFTALSLSSTTNGYINQIERLVRAVSHISDNRSSSNHDDDVADDIEDIKIIVQKQWKLHMLSGGWILN